MVEFYASAEVHLWGQLLGAVVEDSDGVITFEYNDEFRRGGLEVSPVHLPLRRSGPIQFPGLRKSAAFAGLPGLLADALPDRFGNAIIQRYFEQAGTPEQAFSPVQKLLYVGDRAMGALQFKIPLDRGPAVSEQESLEVSALVTQARRVISGNPVAAVQQIMQIGGSAGGARPKAVILWNRNSDRIRSSFADSEHGDEHWIIKFDGVGELDQPDPRPRSYNRVEYVYSQLARQCGIDMEETRLLEERRLGHFLTRRFDRADGHRLHMHSLGGMVHVDYNQPGLYSYEEFFRLMQELGLDFPQRVEGFRRCLFNIMARNQDDHVKNISFLMGPAGRWKLSPAYDLTFAAGQGFTRQHQMSFAGKRNHFDRADVLAIATKFGFKRQTPGIIERINESLDQWPQLANEAGVGQKRIEYIRKSFRRF